MWNLPGCLFYPPPKDVTWPMAVSLMVWKAKNALRRAARERRLFHLWFHPFNLAANPERLLGGLADIFGIEIMIMLRRCLHSRKLQPQVTL